MEFLKKVTGPTAGVLAASIIASGCGPTVTLTSYVETDTYISSTDSTNHSELPYLRVSNTPGSTEERALLKLPTGREDSNENLSQIFGNLKDPMNWPLAPFIIVLDIFMSFFNCTSQTLAPSNLTKAELILNVSQNPGGANLTQLTIQHVSKPWWQTVSWNQAFPFSGSGNWAQGGGDLDSSFTPIAATAPGDGTVHFDVTAYFKTLLTNQSQPHYGFVVRSAGSAAMTPVTLNSVQFSSQSATPRVESTYQCIPPISSGLQVQNVEPAKPYTYYLGPRR